MAGGLSGKGIVGGSGRSGKGTTYLLHGTSGDVTGCSGNNGLEGLSTGEPALGGGGDLPGLNHSAAASGDMLPG